MSTTRITHKDALERFKSLFISPLNIVFFYKDQESKWLNFFKKIFNNIIEIKAGEEISLSFVHNHCKEINLIIYDEFLINDYKYLAEIKEINCAPYIPFMVIVDPKRNNIDEIYEKGVDYVIYKEMFFETSKNPNIKSATYLLDSIYKTIIKGDILKWVWEITLQLMHNMEGKYENGLPIFRNSIYRIRIEEKLRIAFGHLRKPHILFDKTFDLTNEELAFLTYWSCLNEYINEWISSNYENGIYKDIRLKDGRLIDGELNNIYGKYISKEKIISAGLSYHKGVKIYNRPNIKPEDNKYRLRYDGHPGTIIPIILLFNKVTDKNTFIKFAILNDIRNNLIFTHGCEKIKIVDDRADGYYAYENCLNMLEMLYILLDDKWKSYPKENLVKGKALVKKLCFSEKEIQKAFMRYNGKVVKITERPVLIDKQTLGSSFEIVVEKEKQEAAFQVPPRSNNLIKDIKEGDYVELLFSIRKENNNEKQNKFGYNQFLDLEDIIKIYL